MTVLGRLVTLSDDEYAQCERVARERNRLGREGHRAPLQAGESGYSNNLVGCCGEMAVAKWLGVPWDATVDGFKAVADQSGLEVRTRTKDYYELFLRPRDPVARKYILVTRRSPHIYMLRGWAWGGEVMDKGIEKDFGNRGQVVYVLSHAGLRPMETLETM
jgi:hypothetical protein